MTAWAGDDAVYQVMGRYPGEITQEMIPLIKWEGFSDKPYDCGKGYKTVGVGQTGKYATMRFPEVFQVKLAELVSMTPYYYNLPDFMKDALIQANYRGDWRLSPRTRALFDDKKYEEAAEEFLNNHDYRTSKRTGTGVAERMEAVAEAMKKMADG